MAGSCEVVWKAGTAVSTWDLLSAPGRVWTGRWRAAQGSGVILACSLSMFLQSNPVPLCSQLSYFLTFLCYPYFPSPLSQFGSSVSVKFLQTGHFFFPALGWPTGIKFLFTASNKAQWNGTKQCRCHEFRCISRC